MGKCCGKKPLPPKKRRSEEPQAWFGQMIQDCFDYASKAKKNGKKIVGIMCEYTPRELIMAADGVAVCLCGGSAEMIPPAEEHLPANLCPLIKSTYGYHIRRANPFLEMADLLVAETTCDGKKKMYELMGLNRPMYVVELPQKPDDPDAKEHWVSQLRKLKAELEKRFKIKITDAKIRLAIKIMNRERSLRRQLAELMKSPTPPLTGRQLLEFKSIISCIETDFEKYSQALEHFKNKQPCPSVASKVRVLMTGVPLVHGAERVLEIIESNGGLVVCMDNCTGLKPILEDVEEDADDPLAALAEKYFRLPCAVMTKNDRRLEVLKILSADYKPQCIIDLVWQACLTYDIESYRIRQLAEKELKIPYLRIETDYSASDSARIALRVQALFETVRSRSSSSPKD
jgi:benzoyl-CoA reductase/2-hydroxyglutaryl-CoA dehydratase subunit BcrC/BadD/HgdB